MVPDRQKVRTDGRNGRTYGRRQNYIPLTLSGDKNLGGGGRGGGGGVCSIPASEPHSNFFSLSTFTGGNHL